MPRLLLLMLLALAPAALQADTAVRVVRAGTVIDVVGGRTLHDQAIRIEGERIAHIGPWSGSEAGVEIIDWSQYTVVPGLMDMHTHLVGDIQGASAIAPLASSAAQDAFLGAASDVRLPPQMRRGVADSADEVRARVRELLHGGADFIKIIATGAVLTAGTVPGAPEYTEDEIRAAVQEAANYGSYVTAHAHGAEGIKRAVRAGVRAIEHGSLIDDEGIALMKRHGTWLVADIYNGDYIEETGRREGWSAEILQKNRATIEAARLMGREQELGSIESGKYADLVAVHGDVLADIKRLEQVAAVIKGGTVVD